MFLVFKDGLSHLYQGAIGLLTTSRWFLGSFFTVLLYKQVVRCFQYLKNCSFLTYFAFTDCVKIEPSVTCSTKSAFFYCQWKIKAWLLLVIFVIWKSGALNTATVQGRHCTEVDNINIPISATPTVFKEITLQHMHFFFIVDTPHLWQKVLHVKIK